MKLIVAIGALSFTLVACAPDVGDLFMPDGWRPLTVDGAGGSGSDSASSSGHGGGGEAGGGTGGSSDCSSPSDCPGSECALATCEGGTCGRGVAPDGTPIAMQYAGDCKAFVCNGAGGVRSQVDPNDVGDDGNECTMDACGPDGPTNELRQNGTPCSSGFCTVHGTCEDCRVSGPVDDGNECTLDVCEGGVTVYRTSSLNHAPCATGVCDGQGHCVECMRGDDCPSGVCGESGPPDYEDNVCLEPRCDDGVMNGTETDADCGGVSCLGCHNGEGCALPRDCASNICISGSCVG